MNEENNNINIPQDNNKIPQRSTMYKNYYQENNNMNVVGDMNNEFNPHMNQINNFNQNEQLPPKPKDYEIDDTFVEPKKRGLIGGIIMILLLIFVVGAGLNYFFILDSPKNIFLTISEKLLISDRINNEDIEMLDVDLSLSVNMMTDKLEYKTITSVVNSIKLNLKLRGNELKKEDYGNLVITYKNEDLFDFSFLTERDGNKIYGKLNNLLDKVILLELSEEDMKELENEELNEKDTEQDLLSIMNATKSTLNAATYEKNYTKLNNEYVKKISLIIDKTFVEMLLTKLLQDNKFLDSYARLSDMTLEEVQDELNFAINDLEDNFKMIISVYLSIFKNEFIKVELVDQEGNSLNFIKKDDKYSYEYIESYTLKYKGYIKVTESDNKNSLIKR